MVYKRNDGTEIEFTTLLEDSTKANIFVHFKNKNYKILTLATNSETDELEVVYQALYDDFKHYVRPAEMFFEKVDKKKYPDVDQVYRFQLKQ